MTDDLKGLTSFFTRDTSGTQSDEPYIGSTTWRFINKGEMGVGYFVSRIYNHNDGRIFEGINLAEGANLSNDPDFRRARREQRELFQRLGKTKYESLTLDDSKFRGMKAKGIFLYGVTAERSDFSQAEMFKGVFTYARFIESDFIYAKLSEADFSRAHLGKAIFMFADLTRANLPEVKAPYAIFEGADLVGANLSGAFFGGADFSGADLRGVNVEQTKFIGANLSGANLSGLDLRRTKFENVILKGTNLDGAKLNPAMVTAAEIWGAEGNFGFDSGGLESLV